MRQFMYAGVCLFVLNAWAEQTQLTVVSWNVESGDSSVQTIRNRIAAFNGVDIWGLSEVEDANAATEFESGAEDGESADFARIVGTTGGADRLVVIYDTNRFEQVRWFELHSINVGGNVRAPLVAQLRFKETGVEFFFMVNHLYRTQTTGRHEQARLLNAWARTQQLPVVAVGDYNFDWAVTDGELHHDRGYDLLIQDGVFTWVRPATLVKSQCSETFDSVLDFVFVSTLALTWRASSEILVVSGDCPDDPMKSDHRPVRATFTVGPTESGGTTKEQLLQRLDALEREVRQLRTLLEQLP